MNKFTFYPVGQGLFYAGQFDCYPYWRCRRSFIFDCGNEVYIKKDRDKEWNPYKTIFKRNTVARPSFALFVSGYIFLDREHRILRIYRFFG